MPVISGGTLHPNGRGAQAYFPPDFVRQYAFPLEIGTGYSALLVPHRAVVLLPNREPIEFPLEVPNPRTIDENVDPGELLIRGDDGL